jgi:hypothetical protein
MGLYAFDGTWDDANAKTHVWDFFDTYRQNNPYGRDVYLSGVGTKTTLFGKLAGGLWGAGEGGKVDEAMVCAQSNMKRGDKAIDIVGYSRGAATALDFANRAHKAGYHIRFMGLWDTVAAFGLANMGFFFSKLTYGHQLTLPPDNIDYCAHAMALDERRPSFVNTRIHGANEVWFRGCHGDIGGQSQDEGLAQITLGWMFQQALVCGLPIRQNDIDALKPNPDGPIGPTWLSRHSTWHRTVYETDQIHESVKSRPGCVNPPQLVARESRQAQKGVAA